MTREELFWFSFRVQRLIETGVCEPTTPVSVLVETLKDLAKKMPRLHTGIKFVDETDQELAS